MLYVIRLLVRLVSQYVNPAFERLFGYKGDELVGKSSYDVMRSDYTKPDLINSISSQLRAGQVISSVHHLETIIYPRRRYSRE